MIVLKLYNEATAQSDEYVQSIDHEGALPMVIIYEGNTYALDTGGTDVQDYVLSSTAILTL